MPRFWIFGDQRLQGCQRFLVAFLREPNARLAPFCRAADQRVGRVLECSLIMNERVVVISVEESAVAHAHACGWEGSGCDRGCERGFWGKRLSRGARPAGWNDGKLWDQGTACDGDGKPEFKHDAD